MPFFDVLGLGQPIVDFLVRVPSSTWLMEHCSIEPGSHQLVPLTEFNRLLVLCRSFGVTERSGDSIGNTMHFLGLHAGLQVGYCGVAGKDEHGDKFVRDLQSANCISCVDQRAELPTGRVLCLITPDGDRTFFVHLGAAKVVPSTNEIVERFQQTYVGHFTGYMLGGAFAEMTRLAMQVVKDSGGIVSLGVGDPGITRLYRQEIQQVLLSGLVNVIFLNLEEARQLVVDGNISAYFRELRRAHPALYVLLKNGAGGSLLLSRRARIRMRTESVKVIDTTGAGDVFAGAFLQGLLRQWSMEESLRFASRVAGHSVEQIGGRLLDPTATHRFLPNGR